MAEELFITKRERELPSSGSSNPKRRKLSSIAWSSEIEIEAPQTSTKQVAPAIDPSDVRCDSASELSGLDDDSDGDNCGALGVGFPLKKKKKS
jgi:hypothetical protein